MSQAVHEAAWVLPVARRTDLFIPRLRHFNDRFVIPILATQPAGMVRDFANGNRAVILLPKPLRHARSLRFPSRYSGGPLKEGFIRAPSVASGQHGIARCAARRCLHIVSNKHPTFIREPIDVRGPNVVDSVTVQFGAQVVDTNQQHIRPLRTHRWSRIEMTGNEEHKQQTECAVPTNQRVNVEILHDDIFRGVLMV
jgi:hypothetical protein